MHHYLAVGAISIGLFATPVAASTIADAQAAYSLFDVNRAEALYGEVLDGSGTSQDRAVARRELARIAWLVDGDSERAIRILEATLPSDPEPCPTALLYGRILNDTRTATTRAKLSHWSGLCRTVEPQVALEQVRSYLLEARRLSAGDRQRLSRIGLARWMALPAEARASSSGAKLRLALAVQALDARQALEGWRLYFWLDSPALALPVFGLSDEQVRVAFLRGLAPGCSEADRHQLASLLMRAGFVEPLRDLVDRESPSNASSSVVARYLSFREALGREILRHDRAYARGRHDDEDAYERRLSELLLSTARALDRAAADPRAVLRKWFGVWGTEPGKSNGVSGIHLGHVISDELHEIHQDGRKGEIRLIVLDNMIHNSFSAWLMDGASAPGGWAADGSTIVQVRPRYLTLIDEYALLAGPGPARDRAQAEIHQLSMNDRHIAEREPLSFLPSVKARLRFQAIQKLAVNVRASGQSREEFQRAFRNAYWDAMIASSIEAHEGRHVLDQISFPDTQALPDEELEYRAKLSEIRFAPVPRLALSSIYSSLFGGTSGHGKANARLFADYAKWINSNRNSVKGYDPELSALEQLDRLSDAQLVAVAASLDPALGHPDSGSSSTLSDGPH